MLALIKPNQIVHGVEYVASVDTLFIAVTNQQLHKNIHWGLLSETHAHRARHLHCSVFLESFLQCLLIGADNILLTSRTDVIGMFFRYFSNVPRPFQPRRLMHCR